MLSSNAVSFNVSDTRSRGKSRKRAVRVVLGRLTRHRRKTLPATMIVRLAFKWTQMGPQQCPNPRVRSTYPSIGLLPCGPLKVDPGFGLLRPDCLTKDGDHK